MADDEIVTFLFSHEDQAWKRAGQLVHERQPFLVLPEPAGWRLLVLPKDVEIAVVKVLQESLPRQTQWTREEVKPC